MSDRAADSFPPPAAAFIPALYTAEILKRLDDAVGIPRRLMPPPPHSATHPTAPPTALESQCDAMMETMRADRFCRFEVKQ